MTGLSLRNGVLLLALALGVGTGACAPSPAPAPVRTQAPAVLDAAEDRYAAIERFADAIAAHEYPDSTVPAEFARTAAQNLAVRIAAVRNEFETVTAAMSADDLERTRSLWMRLALGQAALELLHEDAVNLSRDAAVSGGEVAELADRISASSALARSSAHLTAGVIRASGSPTRARTENTSRGGRSPSRLPA